MAGLEEPLIIALSIAGVILLGVLLIYTILRLQRRPGSFSPNHKRKVANQPRESSGIGGFNKERRQPGIVQQKIISTVYSEYALREAIDRVKNARLAAQATLSKSDALMEVETNLSTAIAPRTNQLLPFQTTVWTTNPAEFAAVPVQLQEELLEAYIDIRLANDIVWLATEVGRHSDVLNASYIRLCKKIAERLGTVIPALQNSDS
jgi:hypothetical protein